jgi:CspA family cold shock protein
MSRDTGIVKWFNNKAGFGFITVIKGQKEGEDIFVHHSSIYVKNEQYKYLVQGEYVEFTLESTDEGVHKYQATNIRGIGSTDDRHTPLMCETRQLNKRFQEDNEGGDADVVSAPRSVRPPRKDASSNNTNSKPWTHKKTSRPRGQDE